MTREKKVVNTPDGVMALFVDKQRALMAVWDRSYAIENGGEAMPATRALGAASALAALRSFQRFVHGLPTNEAYQIDWSVFPGGIEGYAAQVAQVDATVETKAAQVFEAVRRIPMARA